MQSLTFLQLFEHCKYDHAYACILQADIHRQVHVHAGMPYKFNHYMHACFARNYPEARSHCGHGHDIISVAQLSVINIAVVLLLKRWHQSAIAEWLSMVHCSREAHRKRALMLVYIYVHKNIEV